MPISSSGHLVIAEHFLGIKDAGLPFDVSLHMGTLFAILVYFRQDFLSMGKSLVTRSKNDKVALFHRRMSGFICVACLPAVISALMFGHAAETFLRDPLVVAGTLSGAGLLLLLSEKMGSRSRNLYSISMTDAILIGLSQAIAIIPGVSRSGIT
ncbi:MAG: undecaprenyl-diphosphate phosphatase, partial [Desulfobulbaceae bacterium]|nr:undecaprenyl-diphosphate phosphatase [Desulfobulbaceae bacterium]